MIFYLYRGNKLHRTIFANSIISYLCSRSTLAARGPLCHAFHTKLALTIIANYHTGKDIDKFI